jgi:hypothetical protein
MRHGAMWLLHPRLWHSYEALSQIRVLAYALVMRLPQIVPELSGDC